MGDRLREREREIPRDISEIDLAPAAVALLCRVVV